MTAHTPYPPSVEHFLQQVRETPHGAHAYVALLGLETPDTTELHARVQEGLSWETFERLQEVLDLPASGLASLVQVPPRTLARRRGSGGFEPGESDRLLRLSRLVGLALLLFEEDLEETRRWLTTPHGALNGQTPLEFAGTEVGAREVENLIGRLEHGIPL